MEVVGEQPTGGRVGPRLADDGKAETGGGEGTGHRVPVQGYVVTEPPPCHRLHPGAGIDAGDNRTAVAVGPRVMRATYLLRNPAGGRSDY
jgi:hypothetical protein